MASPIYASGVSPLPPSSFHNGPEIVGRGRDDQGNDCESCRCFRRFNQVPAAMRELVDQTGIEAVRAGLPVIRAFLMPASQYPARDALGRPYRLAAYRCPYADRAEDVVLFCPTSRCGLLLTLSACSCALGKYWLRVIDPSLPDPVGPDVPIPVVPGDGVLEAAR
jgi:hypothetical protein